MINTSVKSVPTNPVSKTETNSQTNKFITPIKYNHFESAHKWAHKSPTAENKFARGVQKIGYVTVSAIIALGELLKNALAGLANAPISFINLAHRLVVKQGPKPGAVKEEELKKLQCFLENNPEQNTTTLKFGDAEIVLRRNSDITTQKADFIVNAANERMLGGGGVDGAISKAGGEELLLSRQLVPQSRQGIRCPVGEARLTDAGCLPSLFCIHAVGPRFTLQQHQECRAQLLHAYTASLKIAHECMDSFKSGKPSSISPLENELRRGGFDLPHPVVIEHAEKLRIIHRETFIKKLQKDEPISISFPTISTGIFGYPQLEGARLSLQAVLEYLQDHQGKPGIKVVQFVFLDQQPDLPYYEQALEEIEQSFKKVR